MRRLSPLDAGFLLAESRETPMHVGGLYLFTLPEGADESEFIRAQLDLMRDETEWRVPFGHKLKLGRLGPAGPSYWEPDDRFDPRYHVRHSALPRPGRYRELFALTGRLHQALLDRHRPLWEMHIIEGLKNRQIALYTKVHHAVIDGVGGVRLAKGILSKEPEARIDYSPFSLRAQAAQRASLPPRPAEPPTPGEVKAVADVLRERLGLSRTVLEGLKTYAKAWLHPQEQKLTTSWWTAPQTSFSTKITGARRFVAQSYSMPRVKAVGKALGGTLNDVVLCMCGGALRRYLLSRNELPDQPLTAMTPISLKADRDGAIGNAVGALTANLATHLEDPLERFETTRASMREGKELLRGMSAKEIELFTQLTQTPPLLIGALGLGDRFPPYSTVISNVPGPRERSYWNGARLDGMYPVSAIFHGFALNFTLLSNADQLDFGVIADRTTVPSVQRIIDHLEESLAELEEAAGVA